MSEQEIEETGFVKEEDYEEAESDLLNNNDTYGVHNEDQYAIDHAERHEYDDTAADLDNTDYHDFDSAYEGY